MKGKRIPAAFRGVPNLGPAMAQDLEILGMSNLAQLANEDPDRLYDALSKRTRSRQDPCVRDSFAAIIDHARTGASKPWWFYTPERKSTWAKLGRR